MGCDSTPLAMTVRVIDPTGSFPTEKCVLTLRAPVATLIVEWSCVRRYDKLPVALWRARTIG